MKKPTEDEIFDLPSDFDPKIYLLLHEDVKEAGIDPVRHYLDFGINENRPYQFGQLLFDLLRQKLL